MMCWRCETSSAKYACPGCDRRSCGLDCVREHKERFSCDGARPPFARDANARSRVDDAVFARDVAFLEEAIERARPRVELPKSGRGARLAQLAKTAKARRGTVVELAPRGLERGSRNRSRFIKKLDKFKWHIEFVGVGGAAGERVEVLADEESTWRDALGGSADYSCYRLVGRFESKLIDSHKTIRETLSACGVVIGEFPTVQVSDYADPDAIELDDDDDDV